jgi:type I restriction enzyme, S subunit
MSSCLRKPSMASAAARRAGWATVAFGDVVKLSTARSSDPESDGLERFVGLDHIDPGDLRIRRWGNVSDGTTFTSVFHPGQVLFGKRRAYQRKVAVAAFTGVCSGDIYVLEPISSRLLPELLPFICQTDAFFEHAVGTSAGSLSPRTNWTSLASFEFQLPTIEDQRRIADALSGHDRLLNALDELHHRLLDAQSAYLEQMLTAGSQGPRHTPVGELLAEPPRNGLSPAVNSDGNGFRTVSIGAVSGGRFTPEGRIKFVSIPDEAARPFLVKAGDMFAVRGNGNRNLVGIVGLATVTYQDLIYPDLLIRLRFDESRILSRFALAQWNLPTVHSRLLSRAKSSNGIWKVNGEDIRAHELATPPISEQRAILAVLDRIDSAAAASARRVELLARLKSKVVLQALGTGHE